jgi:hypothetical protein
VVIVNADVMSGLKVTFECGPTPWTSGLKVTFECGPTPWFDELCDRW